MWSRLVLAMVAVLQIQPAFGVDSPRSVADASALSDLYQYRDGAWRLKPYAGAGYRAADVGNPNVTLASNDWASAYHARGGDADISQKLRREAAYRWTEQKVERLSSISISGMPNWIDVPDGGGVFLGFDYGLK
jgi:hypothetical protein